MSKSRKSIRGRGSRSTTNQLFTMATWLIEEATASASGNPVPNLVMLANGWPEASVEGSLIALRIAENHEPRLFDPGIFLFMRLAIAFTGSIILNGTGRGEKFRLYPRIVPYAGKEAGQSKKPPISVDRITVDAPPGRAVKEGQNHRDRSAGNLHVSTDATAPSEKFAHGREDAIEAILSAYDFRSRARKLAIDRDTYERLLRAALNFHDVRRTAS